MIAAAVMAVGGAILLMVRYKAIPLGIAETWEEAYRIAGQQQTAESAAAEAMEESESRA
jgi:hypothetical protein